MTGDRLSARLALPAGAADLVRHCGWMVLLPFGAGLASFLGAHLLAVGFLILFAFGLGLAVPSGSRGWSGRLRALRATAPVARAAIHAVIDDVLADCARTKRTTAVLSLQIDDIYVADGAWAVDAAEQVMTHVTQRVGAALRTQDIVLRTGEHGVIVVLAPTRRTDLDVMMALVDRMQAAVAEPVVLEGRAVRVRCCVGLCAHAMAPARGGPALLKAADCALRVARRTGGEAVRAFTPDLQTKVEVDQALADEIGAALEAGQIRPWFQPQVDTRTGALAGVEALARWHHPTFGLLAPGRFLPTVEATGRSADLGDAMLKGAIEALQAWDRAGVTVPCVGVNVSLEELTDPRLAERILWQLDRHDMTPDRIAIEILETVTLKDRDETIMRNVRALRDAGLRLDLDDFGTGAASIAHIARFGVGRIKIDRSFIRDIDSNTGQRDIVGAILALADRLSIETLAEGVETEEERETLARLGCPQIQGFGIARPMPYDEMLPWLAARAPMPASDTAAGANAQDLTAGD